MNRSLGPGSLIVAAAMAVATATGPTTAAGASSPRLLVWDQSITGENQYQLRWPMAVAAASNDEIAVADAHGPRLVIFNRDGDLWRASKSIALPGTPVALAHDKTRYLMSLRREPHLIAFEGSRHQIRPLSLPREAAPGAVAAVHNGGFLVHDLARNRVFVLNPLGHVTSTTPVRGHLTALASSASGGFYAAVADEATIRRYGRDGREMESWAIPGADPMPAWPSGLVVEPGGDLLVVDRHAGRLLVLDAGGRPLGQGSRRGWDPGLLLFPAGIAKLPDGRLAVADQGNGRVQIFHRVRNEETR